MDDYGLQHVPLEMIDGATIPLVVNLTVPQIDFLANTASYLQTAWQAIGVQVNVIPDSSDDIVNNLIPREITNH